MSVARVVVCLLSIGLVVAAAPIAAEEALSDSTREALIAAVKSKLAELTDSKNEDGKKNKRADYSRHFRPQEDGTYLASVHVHTANEFDQLTERYELVVSAKDGGEFEVTAAEVVDSLISLHRNNGYACHPFEAFNFDKEGMKLSARNGGVCQLYFQDRVSSLLVIGEGMKYDYEVPEHVNILQQGHEFFTLREVLSRDHSRVLEFDPIRFEIACDADTCDELLETSFTGLDRGTGGDAGVTRVAEVVSSGSSDLDNEVNKRIKEYRENLLDNPFYGFRRGTIPGNRFYFARAVKNDNHSVWINYDNWGGYEVAFGVSHRSTNPEDPRGPLFGYYTEETLKKYSFYELEQRDDEGARWYEVYKLNADVWAGTDDPEMVSVKADVGITIKHDIDILPFFIATTTDRNDEGYKRATLFLNSIRLGDDELTWVKTNAYGGFVVLPKPAKQGDKLEVSMDFDTKAIRKYNSAYSELARFGWIPFVRFGDFVDEFEMTIRTPAEYKVLGVGHKTTETVDGDIKTTHWSAASPVVFPSVIYGRYFSDSPKFKATKADGREIPVEVHVDRVSMMQLTDDLNKAKDVDDFSEEVQSGARGIRGSQLRSIGEQAANSINLYREISGVDYPYDSLNLVNDPVLALYGQAPSSLIYLGSLVFRGEGTMAGDGGILGGGGTSVAKFLKSVVAHEVGHQWWGSAVSNRNQRNYWFVETLAEYFSALYLEAAFGRKEYEEQVEEWRRNVLNNELKTSVQAADSLWPGESGGGARQSLIYNKGPYAFHILRQTFGDEKFFPFLKNFTMELAEKREIVTRDIQMAAEKHLGGVDENGNPYNVDLEWFFDQWIRGVGLPQFTLTYDVTETEDGSYLIQGDIKQQVVLGSRRSIVPMEGRTFRGLIDLTVKGRKKDEEYKKQILVNGESTEFRVKVPVKPVEVAINENGGMLAHDVQIRAN